MSATLPGTRWPRRGSAANRATMTMADQCVASASNFAVGIVVARISGPSGLGAFALAYTVWILLTTLHRSLVTDPMAIMGDMRGEKKEEFVRLGFAADVTLGVMAAFIIAAVGSALLVVGQDTFGVGLLSVAPWVVVLDLPLPFFRKYAAASLAMRVMGIEQIRLLATSVVVTAILAIPIGVANLVLAFVLNFRLGLFGLGAIIIVAVLMDSISRQRQEARA